MSWCGAEVAKPAAHRHPAMTAAMVIGLAVAASFVWTLISTS